MNLVLALRRLRHKDRERYLWMDAILISRCDLADKSHQVAMMGPIYRSASQVICWLGPGDDSIGAAISPSRRIFGSTDWYGVMDVILELTK